MSTIESREREHTHLRGNSSIRRKTTIFFFLVFYDKIQRVQEGNK